MVRAGNGVFSTAPARLLYGIYDKIRQMKPQYALLDTLDDRREIHQLLAKLSPTRRIAFLRWACNQAVLPKSKIRPVVAQKTIDLAALAVRDSSADTRLTLDLYFDLWRLSIAYEFDLDSALTELVAWVRFPLRRSS